MSPESYTITFSIILITGVIIGGLGTIWGALWGTLAIVILPEILKRVNEDVTNLVFGLLLIVIMIFSREGGGGFWQTVRTRWSKRSGGDGTPGGEGSSTSELGDT